MFGICMPELIIIFVIALIVIGPSKLPDLARALGKGMAEFRKATQEIKDSLDIEGELRDAKEDLIDSVSGLDESLDLETSKFAEEEKPEYEGYDDMLGDYEKAKSDFQKEEGGISDTNTVKRNGEDE